MQINHLHPNNRLHLSQFDVERFDDVSPENRSPIRNCKREAARIDAIGEVSAEAQRAFFLLSGSMIHDIYSLRMMLGPPSEVISAEVWSEGQGDEYCFWISKRCSLHRNLGRPS